MSYDPGKTSKTEESIVGRSLSGSCFVTKQLVDELHPKSRYLVSSTIVLLFVVSVGGFEVHRTGLLPSERGLTPTESNTGTGGSDGTSPETTGG